MPPKLEPSQSRPVAPSEQPLPYITPQSDALNAYPAEDPVELLQPVTVSTAGKMTTVYGSHVKALVVVAVIATVLISSIAAAAVLHHTSHPATSVKDVQATQVEQPAAQTLTVNAKLQVQNAALLAGGLTVKGDSLLQGVSVTGNLRVQGNGSFSGSLSAANLNGSGLTVLGNSSFSGNITVSNINASGSLTVGGTVIAGNLQGNISGSFTGSATGTFNGSFNGDGSQLSNIAATNCTDCVRLQTTAANPQSGTVAILGTASITGNLATTGSFNLNGDQTVAGAVRISGDVSVQNTSGASMLSVNSTNGTLTVGSVLPLIAGTVTPGFASPGVTYATVASLPGHAGNISSQAMVKGRDGFMRIAAAVGSTQVSYTRCKTADCASATTTTIKTLTGSQEAHSAVITLDGNGYAYVTYIIRDFTSFNPPNKYYLQTIHCLNDDCTSSTENTLQSVAPPGPQQTNISSPSTTLAGDGLLTVAYGLNADTSTGDSLNIIHCTSVDCSSTSAPVAVAAVQRDAVTAHTFYRYQIVTGRDGYARMAYSIEQAYQNTSTNSTIAVKYIHCQDYGCTSSTGNTLTTNGSGNVSLALDASGNGRIVYQDNYSSTYAWIFDGTYSYSNGNGFISCSDADCTSLSQHTIILPLLNSNSSASMSVAVQTNGLPILTASFYSGNGYIESIRCQDNNCAQVTITDVVKDPNLSGYAFALDNSGMPVIAYGVGSSTTTVNIAQLVSQDGTDNITLATSQPGTTIGSSSTPFGQVYAQGLSLQTASTGAALIVNQIGTTGTKGKLGTGTLQSYDSVQGPLMDLQANSVSRFKVDGNGALTLNANPASTSVVDIQSNGTSLFKVTPTSTIITSGTFSVGPTANPILQTTAKGSIMFGMQQTAGLNVTPYTFSSVTYAPLNLDANATSVTLTDDSITGAINLPFTINFYGQNFTQLFIGSDGYVKLGPSQYATNFGSCRTNASGVTSNIFCQYSITGSGTDLNAGSGGTIKYETLGTAPNRTFVVEFSNVKEFGNTGTTSFQIQISEGMINGGNIISIHTGSVAFVNHSFVQGLFATQRSVFSYDSANNVSNKAIQFTPQYKLVDDGTGSLSVQQSVYVGSSLNVTGPITTGILQGIEQSQTNSGGVATTGLNATWYNSDSANYQTIGSGTVAYQGVDSSVFWPNLSSTRPAGVNSTYFNTRLTGWLKAPGTGLYALGTNAGTRVYINNQLLISDAGTPSCRYGNIYMTAGEWYPVKIEFYRGSLAGGSLYVTYIPGNPLGAPSSCGGSIFSSTDYSATQPQGVINTGSLLKIQSDTSYSGQLQDSQSTGSYLNFNGSNTAAGAVQINTRSATNVGLAVQGSSGQSADLLQLQDVNGAVFRKYDSKGNLTGYGVNNSLLNLAVPAFSGNTGATTGGTLTTPNTYFYVITATNAQGETVASASSNFAPTTTTSTYTLRWAAINGATGYKIYRNTANSFTSGSLLLTTITNGTTTSFTDTGAATTAGLPPTTPTGTNLVVRTWAGQSSAALQVQDSTGTVLASIAANGNLAVKAGAFSGTLTVNGHIITGNTSGTTTAAVGAGAGTSATCTITGNDTSGTVTIVSGASGTSAGTLCTIAFANAYGSAPVVILTPLGNAGASIQYNVGSNATGNFVIATANSPAISTTYKYFYHVTQ